MPCLAYRRIILVEHLTVVEDLTHIHAKVLTGFVAIGKKDQLVIIAFLKISSFFTNLKSSSFFLIVDKSMGILIIFRYVGNCLVFTGNRNGQESSWSWKNYTKYII